MFFFFFFDDEENKEVECNSISEYIKLVTVDIHNIKKRNVTGFSKFKSGSFNLHNTALYEKKMMETGGYKFDLSNSMFYFRGQNSDKFNLVPSVMRDGHFGRENKYYKEIKSECSYDLKGKDMLDKLVTLQHYDCPTRLLDITSNPLVALYFACKDNSDKDDTPGVVYVLPCNKDELLYSDSDKALILSCLAKLSKEEQKTIYNETMSLVPKSRIIDESTASDVMIKFKHEIRKECPTFELKINPLHLLSNHFIKPDKTNSRIMKQDGSFIICGLSFNEEDYISKLEDMIYKKIIINNKEDILNELEKLGITEASLFPELDKVANYIKKK